LTLPRYCQFHTGAPALLHEKAERTAEIPEPLNP
jgi:hypothetical protein